MVTVNRGKFGLFVYRIRGGRNPSVVIVSEGFLWNVRVAGVRVLVLRARAPRR